MTVASEVNRSGPYNGNGVARVFAYDFRIVDETHLNVMKAGADGQEARLALHADYSVAGVGADSGNVTLTAPLAVGATVTLLRDVPFVQETDLENQGPYFAETVEDAFDLSVMRDQQLSERLDRAVQIPASADAAALDALVEDIIRLGDSADAIDTVAGIRPEVITVAGIAPKVVTVAGVAPQVATVAAIAPSVVTVAGVAASIPVLTDLHNNMDALIASHWDWNIE